MKFVGCLVLLLGAAAVEAALPRVLLLDQARPLLVVVLVVHFARTLELAPGVLLAGFGGLVEDATCGYPMGLATFACVLVLVLARLAFGGLAGEGRGREMTFSAAGAFVWLLAMWLLSRLLGPPHAAVGAGTFLRAAVWSCPATALTSPLVLAAGRRLDRLERRPA